MQGLTLATLQDEVEEWKTLPIHAGYQISNLGRVLGPRGLITPTDNGRGYLRFSVNVNGHKESVHVHQAVCELFNGEAPLDKPFALHDDNVKHNCRWDNLHWGSHQDNMDERATAGRIHCSKLNLQQVQEIRRLSLTGASNGSLGRQFGVTGQYVGKLVKGKLVKGKTWKEAN